MTKEERIYKLHKKMAERKRKKEDFRTAVYGVCSLFLFAGLLILTGSTGLTHQGTTAGLYSGATLLFQNTGGYVLTALIAFMAGVVVTIMLKIMKENNAGEDGK